MKKVLFLMLIIISIINAQDFPKNKEKFQTIILSSIQKIYNDLRTGYSINNIVLRNNSDILPIDNNLRLLLKINYDNPDVINEMINEGCEIVNYTEKECYLWIPFDKIEKVASNNNVLAIWNKGIFYTRSAIIGEGLSALNGDKAKELFYVNGNGIKVGVISDGMKYHYQSFLNGDLPSTINTVDNSWDPNLFPGSEGTAMMEIIYDFAPNAEFWFGGINSQSTPLTMAQRIYKLSNNGCKVIVDDIGWLAGIPYFQEWEISAAINSFVLDKKGCYISAAGNENGRMYTGNSYNISNTKCLLWQGNDSLMSITVNNCRQISIYFQWANDWMNSSDNFDLYLYGPNGNLLDSSVTLSGYGKHPEEIIKYSTGSVLNGTYTVKVVWKNYFYSAKPEVKLFVDNIGGKITLEYPSTNKQIYGHNITRNHISVAAASYKKQGVEPFSSRGPALVYTSSGMEERKQPFITAVDSVSTYVGQQGNFSNPFSGTSAAAPHVAGIAVLFYNLTSNFNPQADFSHFLNACKNSAQSFDGGSPENWDIKSGYGMIDAVGTLIFGLNQVSNKNFNSSENIYWLRLIGNTNIASNLIITIPTRTTSSIKGNVSFGSNSKLLVYGTLIIEKGSSLDYDRIEIMPGGNIYDETGNLANVTVSQVDQYSNPFGQMEKWNSQWISFNVPKTFFLLKNSINVFRADTNFKQNSFEKFNNWNNSSKIINHDTFKVTSDVNKIIAHFKETHNVTIETKFPEVNTNINNFVEFKDPWLRDTSDDKGIKNRGINALWYRKNSPFYITTNSEYKGVFLDQRFDIPNHPHYTVKSDAVQYIELPHTGRVHPFYFQGWSVSPAGIAEFQNANALETAVVFKQEGATVSANYKGSMLSNSVKALSSSLQRKVVRTNNGHLHIVYESMGNLWYQKSVNNGSTWYAPKLISYPDQEIISKNPFLTFYDNTLYLVFESFDVNGGYGVIDLYSIDQNGNITNLFPYPMISIEVESHPSVAVDEENIIIVFKETFSEPLKLIRGFYQNGQWNFSDVINVSNSTDLSCNPVIISGKSSPYNTAAPNRKYFHLVWEEREEPTRSELCYLTIEALSTRPEDISFNNFDMISRNSGYERNTSANLISVYDASSYRDIIYVGWVGQRKFYPLNDYDLVPDESKAVLWISSNKNRFYTFGDDVECKFEQV